MANEEHLKILRLGVEAWNAWRGENPEITPDLRGARLDKIIPRQVPADVDGDGAKRLRRSYCKWWCQAFLSPQKERACASC